MLAKAGESDRAIRVKMVRFFSFGSLLDPTSVSSGRPLTFIFPFFTIVAEASLLWEAQGRQNQPPINTWGLVGIHFQYILIDIALFCSCTFHLHFMTYSVHSLHFSSHALELKQSKRYGNLE